MTYLYTTRRKLVKRLRRGPGALSINWEICLKHGQWNRGGGIGKRTAVDREDGAGAHIRKAQSETRRNGVGYVEMAVRRDSVLCGMTIGGQIESFLAGIWNGEMRLEIAFLPDQQARRYRTISGRACYEQGYRPMLRHLKAQVVALSPINGDRDRRQWSWPIEIMPIERLHEKWCSHKRQRISKIIGIDKPQTHPLTGHCMRAFSAKIFYMEECHTKF
jgi:hypothetical protein